MPSHQILSNHIETVLLGILLIGLVVRGRASFCWSFFFYILAILVNHRLIIHWPDRFWVFSFQILKEVVFYVLKALIAVEIWRRSFSSFPRARLRVGLFLLCALAVTAVAGHLVPTNLSTQQTFWGVIVPRWQAGLLLMYALLAATALWHRVPFHPLHRAILLGLGVYLALHTVVLTLIGWRALRVVLKWPYEAVFWIEAVSFSLTILCWSYVAWRPSREPSPIASKLQPWARSW